MTKFLQERICTFLIHRYMGDYLKTELSTEQLQVRLQNGTVSVQNVGLNVEYINNTLEKAGLVSLVEGFIGEISLNVPLMNLLAQSTVIKIKGLDLTVTPLKEVNMTNTQDLVSSMIGSICSSSMDLARSIVDEDSVKDSEGGGVEQFASMIDQVISRIKVIFEDTTIRLESESDMCIGLEARIERMEFVDEQLEACEQQKQSLETITSQPNSLYTVTDLNKLLHIQGVKLYTDIWTPEKTHATSSMSSSVEQDLPSPVPSLDMSMATSNVFQSCYSHFSSRTSRFTTSRSIAGRSDISIPPNPIPFAQFFGDRNTIRIRVHNTALTSRDGAFNRKVDIEIQLGGSLFFFLTPSQLVLIQDILSRIVPKPVQQGGGVNTGMAAGGVGGRPMQEEHFQQITGQFHSERGWSVNPLLSRSPMAHNQTWGGGDVFYELGPRSAPNRRSFADRTMSGGGADLVSVPLDSQLDDLPLDSSTMYTDMDSQADNDSLTDRTHHGSSSTLVERKPDVFGFAIKVPSMVGVITHEDPLNQANIKKEGQNEAQTGVACEVITKMAESANAFFARAANLKLGVQNLSEQRQAFDFIYQGDQLRFVSKGVRFKFSSERNGTSDRIDLYATFNKCDFIESLLEKSVLGASGVTHVDILNFSSSNLDNQTQNMRDTQTHDLSLRLSTTYDRDNDFSVEINMGECKSEVDLSIIDRICNLLIPKPFFQTPLDPEKAIKTDFEPSLALRDTLEPVIDTDSSASFQLMFNCPKWTIDMRIPIADLRESSVHYSIRNLYPEYLHLVMENSHLELPKFKASQIAQHGSVKIDCNILTGSFLGYESVLECSKEEMKFLYATSKDRDSRVGFKISYDFRNKSLKVVNHQTTNIMQKSIMEQSMMGSFFKFKEEDKIEGPFAQSKIFYEDSKFVMAGNKEELKDFSEKCRLLSNVNIEINVPSLNLCLPSHKFYEVVYNRFGNDLALFAPKAPVFKSSITPAANLLNPLINLDDRQFEECQSFHTRFDPNHDDYDDNGSSDRTSSSRKNSETQTSSHDFTLSLNIAKAKILLQSNVVLPENSFLTNLGTEIANAEMFLVYGFHSNPDLAYFFISAEKAHLYHRNILEGMRPYEKSVTESNFCKKDKNDIHAEPVPSDELTNPVDDNNLAVALKIHTYFDVKSNCHRKDIIVAVAVRNTLVHFRPFRNPNHFWVQQFADFFNVVDYDVPGYVWPKTMIGMHLHLTSCLFGYDHASVIEGSPLKLRVEIGSCDISSNIVQNMEKYKFRCVLEEMKVYLSAKKRQHSVNFEPSARNSKKTTYVKLLSMGLLHLEVDYALPLPQEDGLLSPPTIEVLCKNDLLKLWLCSDSLTEFINMVSEFVESDIFSSMTASSMTEQQNEALIQLVNEANMSASMMSGMTGMTGVSSNRQTIAGELTEEDEERVMDMMNAAMQENSMDSSPKTSSAGLRRESASSDPFEATKMPNSRSSHSVSSNNTDDEFIVVDEIPGSGITKPSGEPRTRILDNSFEIVSSHFDVPEPSTASESVRLPAGQPPPIVKYEVRDFSILIYLFGGNDFGDRQPEESTYSVWQTKRESPECHRDGSLGGPFRDHTVCVEARLEKISFLAEVFPSTGSILSLNMLTVQDVTVSDHVLVSNINKIFYQYTSPNLPRRTFAPLLSVRMVEDQAREGKLKISLLPIRLNFDQDTVEFLEDFFTYVGTHVRGPNIPMDHGNDAPIMEVPPQDPTQPQTRPGRAFSMMSTESATDTDYAVRMSKLEEAVSESGSDYPSSSTASADLYPNLIDIGPMDELPPARSNLDYLFSDEDPTLEDSTYSSKSDSFEVQKQNGSGSSLEQMNDLMTTIMLESRRIDPNAPPRDPDTQDDDNSTVVGGSTVTRRTSATTLKAQQMSRETFFKEFTFSPACTIAIDYNGKRVHTKKGALMGLLLGMSSVNKAELTLKELYNPKGMIGYNRCMQFAIEEWYKDISRNQLGEIVGSYGPMSSLKHIALGIRDLFVMPLVEYRKEDGRVVKGIQKGASSFGVSAAAATIDATQRLAFLIQNVAELAFDIVTPDPYLQNRRRAFVQRARVPTDIREGLHMAYDTITEGVRDTSQNLQNALQEDRASGHWPIRGLLRQATPTAIRPIVIASQAAVQLLSGFKNQIKPEDYREELEKWRHADPNRFKAIMSKYQKM